MKKTVIKEHNPWANINIVDMLSILDPSKTNKFLPFLVKHYKNVINNKSEIDEKDWNNYRKDIIRHHSISEDKIDTIFNFSKIEIDIFNRITEMINKDYNVKEILEEFNEHCNSYRIENTDIGQYNNINDIIETNRKANFKILKNHKEQKVHVVMEDKNWLLIKPLTFESSLKYGSSTKWCTAMKNNPDYFYRYSKRGILIYIINKNTLVKTACFIPLDGEESSYSNPLKLYNEKDVESDSFVLNLDNKVMETLMVEFNDKITNYELIKYNYPEIYKEWIEYERNESLVSENDPTNAEEEFAEFNGVVDEGIEEEIENDEFNITEPGPEPPIREYERMRITNNGRTEIGTINQIQRLHISTDGNINVNNTDYYISQINEYFNNINPIRKFFNRFFSDKLITVGVPVNEINNMERIRDYFNNDFNVKGYKFLVYPSESKILTITKL
jgi:hypothetical protein